MAALGETAFLLELSTEETETTIASFSAPPVVGMHPRAHSWCKSKFKSVGTAVLLMLGLWAWCQRSRSLPATKLEVGSLFTEQVATRCRHVACIGTSVTKGNVSILHGGVAAYNPYPQVLQDLLGSDFCVHNLGIPDRTVLQETETPFQQTAAWQWVTTVAPDVVILQFGSRDTSSNSFSSDFHFDYGAMISSLKALRSRPLVYIMSVPPIYLGSAAIQGHMSTAYGMPIEKVNRLHAPLKEIARENGIAPPISVFTVFHAKCPVFNLRCGLMSADGVHPNDRGHQVIGRLVRTTIRGDDRCAAPASARRPCPAAAPGVGRARCRDVGCCFDGGAPHGVPRCFQMLRPISPSHAQCNEVDRLQKTACAENSSPQECMARGCCYKPSLDGTPWCYHHMRPTFVAAPDTSTSTVTITGTTTTSITTTTTKTSTFTSTSTPTQTRRTTSSATTSTTTCTSTSSSTSTSTSVAPPVPSASIFAATAITTTTSSLALAAWEDGDRTESAQEREGVAAIPVPIRLGGLLVIILALCCFCFYVQHRCGGDKVCPSAPHQLDRILFKEDEEQRQMRRLEVDLTLKRVDENRVRRELDSMLAAAGFAGINDAKVEKGLFTTGHTYPLHAAVKAKSAEAVAMLLRAKADADLADSRRRTPLALAVQLNRKDSHRQIIVALQDAGSVEAMPLPVGSAASLGSAASPRPSRSLRLHAVVPSISSTRSPRGSIG